MQMINVKTARILVGIPGAAPALATRAGLTVSPPVAAILTGRSIPAVRGAVDRGDLPASGATHRTVTVHDLARWAARNEFCADDWARVLRDVRRRDRRTKEE